MLGAAERTLFTAVAHAGDVHAVDHHLVGVIYTDADEIGVRVALAAAIDRQAGDVRAVSLDRHNGFACAAVDG